MAKPDPKRGCTGKKVPLNNLVTVRSTFVRCINRLFIHCADLPDGDPRGVAFIDKLHRARRFRRKAAAKKRHNPNLGHVGYHYVIPVDGRLQTGRHPDESGAQVHGYNAHSIGVCLIGRSRYSPAQWATLRTFVRGFQAEYPDATVHGHREVAAKSCPGFDVQAWLAGGMKPLPKHLLRTLKGKVLRKGAKGESVEALQRLLKRRGLEVSVDGDFGPGTQRALQAFQRSIDMVPDGLADEVVLERLKTGP